MSNTFLRNLYNDLPDNLKNNVYNILRKKEINSFKECFNLIDNEKYDEKYEEKLLIDILRYAYDNSNYYKKMFEKNNIDINNLNVKDIEKIDLLDKQIIRDNIEDIKVNNFNNIKKIELRTGGTTGIPLHFYRSIEQGVIDRRCLAKLYKSMGYEDGDTILTFNGSKVNQKKVDKGIYWDKKGSNIPYGSIYISSLYLSKDNIDKFIEQLIYIKPAIIRGYPSFIYDVCEYIVKNDIKINFNVKGVMLTSEVYTDRQVDIIKKALNTEVYYQYGHAEACVYAYAKEDGVYYCNPYYGYVEILNNDGDHVQVGEIGEVVVTSYYNKVMPFIRYRTSDLAQYGGKVNGEVILNRIYGRTQDCIYNEKGEKFSLMTAILTHRLKAFDNIRQWKIIQKEKGNITIQVVKDRDYSIDDENQLKSHIKNLCDINVKIKYVDSINKLKNGKSRFLEQYVV